MPIYYDAAVNRMREPNGRFSSANPEPDEHCPNGCERWGDWWLPADCPTHLNGN